LLPQILQSEHPFPYIFVFKMEDSFPRSPLRKISDNEAASVVGDSTSKHDERTKVGDVSSSSTVSLPYPQDISLPTRDVVECFYKEAVAKEGGEQSMLTEYGMLSFQDVLLPIVGHEEERALKRLQSVVQRDHSELTSCVVMCRKAVLDSIGAGMDAAAKARQLREQAETDREAGWAEQRMARAQEKEEEKVKRMEEKEKMNELKRKAALREAKKNLSFNQDLYREHAYLLSELPKLQKEEKAWREAEIELKKREAELETLEKELEEKGVARLSDNNRMEIDDEEPLKEVEQAIRSVKISSVRIQELLQNVSDVSVESDKVRKELYHKYRKDHQFHGYQGAANPKGLLLALSQSQQSAPLSQEYGN
jgi:hypothetical protein